MASFHLKRIEYLKGRPFSDFHPGLVLLGDQSHNHEKHIGTHSPRLPQSTRHPQM